MSNFKSNFLFFKHLFLISSFNIYYVNVHDGFYTIQFPHFIGSILWCSILIELILIIYFCLFIRVFVPSYKCIFVLIYSF